MKRSIGSGILGLLVSVGFTPAVLSAQSRCLNVPAAVQSTIAEELIDVNGRPRVARAQAVRTSAFNRAHFVSVVFYAPGLEDGEVLTWLVSGELANPGMWVAADRMTEEFSFVPYAGDTRVGNVRSDDGYQEARRCARAAARRE